MHTIYEIQPLTDSRDFFRFIDEIAAFARIHRRYHHYVLVQVVVMNATFICERK